MGPLHPAPPRHRRRPHRRARAGGARRPLLHAARAPRRRRAHHRAAARARGDLHRPRARHRRRHRPAEHPVPLDPDRGHAGDLAQARGPRDAHHRGLRRHPAGDPRFAGRRHRGRREARPRARPSTDDPRPLHRQPGVLQPAAQVQDRDLLAAGRRPRGQRHLVRRRRAPRARPRLRRVGRRRAVHQPEDRAAARRVGAARRGARRVGRHRLGLPGLRLPPAAPPGPHQVPRRRLGCREVPPGAGGRVPGPEAGRRPGPGHAGAPHRPRRCAQAEGRAQLRRRRARGGPGVRPRAGRAGRRRREGRLAARAAHPAAEDRRARRAATGRCLPCRRS